MAGASDVFEGRRRLSLNEEILRDTIRHAIYLQRVKTQLARETVGFLNDEVFPDVLERLLKRLERISLRGADSGAWETKRFVALAEDLHDIVVGGIEDAEAQLEKLLRDVARIEAAFSMKQVERRASVDLALELPPARVLNDIVASQPFNGATMSEWFDDLAAKTQARLTQQVKIGLVEGETVEAIARRVRGTRDAGYADGILQVTRREAEAIARTATGHVSARAREAVYDENDDLIDGVMWVATLDTRTCPVCAARDGKVYKIGQGPRPEAHWNCRCTTTPVLKSWEELGINLRDAPAGTRASMNGQVPDALSFPDWLRGQPAEIQNEALGPVRARLWRAGEVSFQDFVDDRGRTLTLAELAKAEGLELPAQYLN